jgi:hypothetical protein
MRLLGTLAAVEDDRVLRYTLLPYGQPGQTNLGTLTATRGRLTLPEPAEFVLNLEHDSKRPVGIGQEFSDGDDALQVAIRVLATSAGDDLLVEAREGVRTGISVEVDAPVVRAGRLLGGRLSGAGACTEPAFEAARLVAGKHTAPDEGEPGDDVSRETSDDDESEEGDDMQPEDTQDPVATAPKLAANRAKQTPKPVTATDAFKLLAAARNGDPQALAAIEASGATKLFGALTLVTEANGAAAMQPQWIGEAFATTFVRRIIPLLTNAPLTSTKIAGWKWATKPTVGAFAGPPAEITSTPVALVPVTEDANRWAGGNRIDRRYVDFNDTDMIASYLKALSDSYHEETDDLALAVLVGGATPVVAGTVPTDVPAGLVKIVDGALAVVQYGQPSFAIVATDSWRDIVLSKSIDALAYITTSLSLDEGSLNGFRIVPHAGMSVGSVLVGIKAAATHYELPGSPLRVNAQAVAVGAVDEAVFGYDATLINDARGLALVA